MPLTLVTPPAIEPVTLDDAKAYLKVDTADDDALIAALIAAARARAEWHTGRALVTQGWTLYRDAWPQDGSIEIPLPPLQTVTALTATLRDGSTQTIDAAHYVVDWVSAPGRLVLKPDFAPPTDLRAADAIALAFLAGYGDEAAKVPALLKQAILAIVAFLYDNRGEAPADLPPDCLALLAPYRVLKL